MTTTNDHLAKREEIFSAPSGHRSLIRALDCPFAAILITIVLFVTGCSSDGGGLADSGGMSGTGISQGAVSSFGSVFVNGVRWDLSSATIEIDGMVASESDLRVGMVVRVEGDFAAGNADGTATRVTFEDVLEGPIENAPVETVPGMIKTFTILGQTVAVDALETIFDDGATFATLAANEVLEVSGFSDGAGGVQASRVSLRGTFPGDNDVDLIATVSNLVVNPDDSGLFDLGPIVVRFTQTTPFTDVTRATLMNGDRVKVEGTLRPSGTEVDATEVELEDDGLGADDLERVELEGFATACPESTDFCVGGVPVDTSMATFDPATYVPMIGDRVEVEGPLVSGTLEAIRVESEDEDPNKRNVRIEAAVTSIDNVARTLVVLGVTVVADGETVLEDNSLIEDENFRFTELMVGDFVKVQGIDDGGANVRALSIVREDASEGDADVRLEGPVTGFDVATPTLEILGQSVPLNMGTLYFDDLGAPRTEEQFFRDPGDVMLGDVVSAEDFEASDLSILTADEVSIDDPI
ncbi:DUF5666 domain-containing protein [Myxococcota bacterium]|nr:DUF5666 domain-containing protein [Myxococcota bacterium]